MNSFDKSKVDYTLYLVTDSGMLPKGVSICDQVEKAVQNGVTIVQLREKTLDTAEFIERARKIHEITKKYNIPLLINDRLDVAIAVNAEGIHIGQDDMDPKLARKMIGENKILGLTIGNENELYSALQSDVTIDYVGMGAVYSTNTKKLKKVPFGIEGVKHSLKIIQQSRPTMKSVIIGGLNKTNIAWTLFGSEYNGFNTNGVAVVSCIMAQRDAALETQETLAQVKSILNKQEVEQESPNLNNYINYVKEHKPVVHHITNGVVKNISANIAIAVGASPIMSECAEEFSTFAEYPNASLVLNTGTLTDGSIELYKRAIKAYNFQSTPIVYDPVACGASISRRHCMNELMEFGYFTVIKGNLAELCAIASGNSNMRGVDSNLELDIEKTIGITISIAISKRAVVVLTGKEDIVVDGITPGKTTVFIVKGGHRYMGKITGSGCSLGSVIASFVASVGYSKCFEATVSAVAVYKEAGYLAGKKSQGPGSFSVNFIDELYNLTQNGSNFPNTLLKKIIK